MANIWKWTSDWGGCTDSSRGNLRDENQAFLVFRGEMCVCLPVCVCVCVCVEIEGKYITCLIFLSFFHLNIICSCRDMLNVDIFELFYFHLAFSLKSTCFLYVPQTCYIWSLIGFRKLIQCCPIRFISQKFTHLTVVLKVFQQLC